MTMLDHSAQLYAFRCDTIVDGQLWHWMLVPMASVVERVDDVMSAARVSPPERWLLVIEDLRDDATRTYDVEIHRGSIPAH